MNHKPTGQLLGNAKDTGVLQDAPGNAANSGLPTTQPEGARFLAFGEGARSANFNRALVALGFNIDQLFAKLTRNLAIATRLTSNEVPALVSGGGDTLTLEPAGFPTQSTPFEGWVYHGQSAALLPNYFRILDSATGLEVNVASNEVRVTGVEQDGDDLLTEGSRQISVSDIAISKPAATTDARHILELDSALDRFGTASAKGLLAHIESSTATDEDKGNNDGVYVVADASEVTPLETFILRERYYRVRVKNWTSSNWAAGDEVTGATSGTVGVVRDTSGSLPDGVGLDYLEFEALTAGRTFLANEEIEITAGGNVGETADVVYSRVPGDPVTLNNDMSAPGTATFYTDGDFSCSVTSQEITLQLNETLPAGTYIVVCGTRTSLYEMPVPGFLEGGSTSSVDDFSSIIDGLGLGDHTDGGANKHDASEIDFADTGGADNLSAGTLEATIDAIDDKMGDLSALTTAAQDNLKDAINEVASEAAAAQTDADAAQTTADAAIPASEKGANDGVATLDSGGQIPAAQFDDTTHGNRGGGALHADVIAGGADGFMTGADKTKLDGIATAANNYSLSKSAMETSMGDDSSDFDINGAILVNSNLKAQEGESDHMDGSYSGAVPELDGSTIAPGFVRGHCVIMNAGEALSANDIVTVDDDGNAIKTDTSDRIPIGVVRKAASLDDDVLVQVAGVVVLTCDDATMQKTSRVTLKLSATADYQAVEPATAMTDVGVLGITTEKYTASVGSSYGIRLVPVLLMPSGTT